MKLTSLFTMVAVLALGFGSLVTGAPTDTVFLRGDVNGDDRVDPLDTEALEQFLTSGGELSVPVLEALDVLDDGKIDSADLVELHFQLSVGVAGHEYDVLEFVLGDVRKDGRLDAEDYYQLVRVVRDGAPVRAQMDAADINGDGRIDSTDLRFFRQLLRSRR